MHKNTLAFVIVAALGGFIAGFWLANSINRTATTVAPSANQLANSAAATPGDDLTDAEIREKIVQADRNPSDKAFNRDLGVSLYRYAAMKQDAGLLTDAVRILERSTADDPKNFDVMVALGNAHFDIGFYNKDAASFQKAREVYVRALTIRPADPDVMTDLGLTWFLQEPPDLAKAAAELEKVGAANPRHERSRQFLVQTYVRQKRIADAEKALESLRAMNPSNSMLAELTNLINTGKAGTP